MLDYAKVFIEQVSTITLLCGKTNHKTYFPYDFLSILWAFLFLAFVTKCSLKY